MSYVEPGMIQYDHPHPQLTEDDLKKYKVFPCGNTGISILYEEGHTHPLHVLFGNIITHSFASYDKLEEWNNTCNAFMIALPVEFAIIRMKAAKIFVQLQPAMYHIYEKETGEIVDRADTNRQAGFTCTRLHEQTGKNYTYQSLVVM